MGLAGGVQPLAGTREKSGAGRFTFRGPGSIPSSADSDSTGQWMSVGNGNGWIKAGKQGKQARSIASRVEQGQ